MTSLLALAPALVIGSGIVLGLVSVLAGSTRSPARLLASRLDKAPDNPPSGSAGGENFVAEYVFPAGLTGQIRGRIPDLSDAQVTQVLEGLRSWFVICTHARAQGLGPVGMPSQAVDLAWREFMSLSDEYAEFCAQAFGCRLLHTPASELSSPPSAALGTTVTLASREAGGVPLLFAIDGQLGLASGMPPTASSEGPRGR